VVATETRPPETPVRTGWALLRNGWRALTSMRIALVLLFLLALGALPGALLPQRSLNQGLVDQYFADQAAQRSLRGLATSYEAFGCGDEPVSLTGANSDDEERRDSIALFRASHAGDYRSKSDANGNGKRQIRMRCSVATGRSHIHMRHGRKDKCADKARCPSHC
jgi:hypothetical protein